MRAKYLSNIALGTFIGTASTLVLGWLFDSKFSDALENNFSIIFSATTTLFAASLALAGVLTNIQNQLEQEKTRRKESIAAAKATMPLALSQLVTIAMRGAEISLDLNCEDYKPNILLNQLAVNDGITKTLKECIEFASLKDGARLQHYQALSSAERQNGLFAEGSKPN